MKSKMRDAESINEFTQSQAHGLYWDSEVRENVFKLPFCKNDTKKYDIDYFENIFNQNENVSIKTTGNNGFGGGDILRFFNIDFDKKCTIIVIKYNQEGASKKIKEVIEIDYSLELRNHLFGSVTIDVLSEYVNYIRSIPHGKAPNEVKKYYKNWKKDIQNQYNMIISINPKVDSKSQRRVQCGVSDVDSLIRNFPNCLISRSTNAEVRGVKITESIKSEPRKRNKSLKT